MPSWKHNVVSRAIRAANTSTHDFRTVVGIQSIGDDFLEWIRWLEVGLGWYDRLVGCRTRFSVLEKIRVTARQFPLSLEPTPVAFSFHCVCSAESHWLSRCFDSNLLRSWFGQCRSRIGKIVCSADRRREQRWTLKCDQSTDFRLRIRYEINAGVV